MDRKDIARIIRKVFVSAMVGLVVIFLVAELAPLHAQEEFAVRAPAAVKGTTEDMLAPNYWISRIDNPDRVIMTVPEIEALNEKNADRSIRSDHPYTKNIETIEKDGPIFNRPNPLTLDGTFSGGVIKKRLETNNARLRKGTFYDNWALPLTDGKKDEWIEAVDIGSVPDTVSPKTAMIVHHTTARLYPTPETAYRMRGYLDDNSVSSLDIGMPAAVMHRSKTGDYLFVMTPIAWGWVPAGDIAYASPRTIERYSGGESFIVVTGHKVPLYADMEHTVSAGYLYLGERVQLLRTAGDDYLVSVPVRRYNGELEFRWAFVSLEADVHEGWVPYTQRNAISLAFRLLGRPYGWHDSWGERDCGGIMRVIFNCFGFDLPRYWSFEQLYSDRATFVGDSGDAEKKNAMLLEMPAGITFVGTTGHIGLYLGTVGGKPYGIHQCGWNYKDEGTEYKMARVVVTDFVNIGFNMDRMQFFTPIAP